MRAGSLVCSSRPGRAALGRAAAPGLAALLSRAPSLPCSSLRLWWPRWRFGGGGGGEGRGEGGYFPKVLFSSHVFLGSREDAALGQKVAQEELNQLVLQAQRIFESDYIGLRDDGEKE